jgi:glycosyltransferase involved in cell wall biosynthesis
MAHRIFINDNIPSPSTQRGVARAFRKITDGMIAEFGPDVIIYSPEVRDYGQAQHIQAQPRSAPFRGTGLLGINYFLSKYSDTLATKLLKKYTPSIVYSPYYGNLESQAHQVFTVHDMMHELFPQYFSRARFDIRDLLAQKKSCFERATMLLAISESTAKDIRTFYPNIDPKKVVVTPLGVDDFFFQSLPISTSGDKPYFLYVGHRGDYKNFLRLLIAFGQSNLAKNFDLRVISPSGSRFSSIEMQQIRTYNLQNSIRLVAAVNEVHLQENYAQAAAFVYPSEYEGFGLPILEAMASGTLVATSNTSSMPEVGGPIAFYFNPYDTCSITECLLRLASLSIEERNRRLKDGLAWARTFTWARCQQKVIEVMYPLI